MIGLERGTVELVPYQGEWPERYEREVERLTDIAGDRFVEFEHIGSTAIEGMPAKPIIDILAVVEDLDETEAVTPALERHGYERRPDTVGERLFFAKGPRASRTVYLSVAEMESDFYHEKIAFRDHLRESPELAERYASVKKRLAEKYPGDRDKYTAEKGEFIRGVLNRAGGE